MLGTSSVCSVTRSASTRRWSPRARCRWRMVRALWCVVCGAGACRCVQLSLMLRAQRERGRIMQECAGADPGIMVSLAPCTQEAAREVLAAAEREARETGVCANVVGSVERESGV